MKLIAIIYLIGFGDAHQSLSPRPPKCDLFRFSSFMKSNGMGHIWVTSDFIWEATFSFTFGKIYHKHLENKY